MKRIILTAAIIAATTIGSLSAQNQKPQAQRGAQKPTQEQMEQKFSEKLTKELGLTESQAQKFIAINKNRKEQLKSSMETAKQAHKQAEVDKMKQIINLLNEDQLAKLMILKNHAPKHPAAKSGRKGRAHKPTQCKAPQRSRKAPAPQNKTK